MIKYFFLLGLSFLFLSLMSGCAESSQLSINDNKNEEIDVTNVILDDTFFSSLDAKNLILYKIMNSIDYFNNAVGQFERQDFVTKEKQDVKYIVDVKNRKGYQRIIDTANGEDTEIIVNNRKRIQVNNQAKTYREFNSRIEPRDEILKLLKPKDRYSKKQGYILKSGKKYVKRDGYLQRNDNEYLLVAAESLYNQDYLISYLEIQDNWTIIGNEKYLNRDSIIIAGNLGFVDKRGAVKFNVLVDKNTGIVLKFEFLNNKDQIVSSLITTNIQIDNKIDVKQFEKDLTGYSKN